MYTVDIISKGTVTPYDADTISDAHDIGLRELVWADDYYLIVDDNRESVYDGQE